jgi:hypothetical protein
LTQLSVDTDVSRCVLALDTTASIPKLWAYIIFRKSNYTMFD